MAPILRRKAEKQIDSISKANGDSKSSTNKENEQNQTRYSLSQPTPVKIIYFTKRIFVKYMISFKIFPI